jgi:hypothetical protein
MINGDPPAGNDASSASALPEPQRRKPYARPQILSREPLEAMAATCARPFGKASGICSTARS